MDTDRLLSVELYYDGDSREWDGMVRELLEQRADLAIADLTITFDREQVFTLSSWDSVLVVLLSAAPSSSRKCDLPDSHILPAVVEQGPVRNR